jgi:hypothetical protein
VTEGAAAWVCRVRMVMPRLTCCRVPVQFAWAAPELLLGARCTEKVDVRTFNPVPVAAALLPLPVSLQCIADDQVNVPEVPVPRSARCYQGSSVLDTAAVWHVVMQCHISPQIFSFGVVLWELVTGERPLRGQTRELRCVPVVASVTRACSRTAIPFAATRPPVLCSVSGWLWLQLHGTRTAGALQSAPLRHTLVVPDRR